MLEDFKKNMILTLPKKRGILRVKSPLAESAIPIPSTKSKMNVQSSVPQYSAAILCLQLL